MAGSSQATTTVHVDARRPFAALELPDKEKFTGKNHPAFVRNLRIILRYLKVLYLIDGEAQKKPVNAVEEDDKELLYMCLHRNLEENGKDLIAEHGGDGVKAWKAFNKRFGQADTGTTMDKFWEHISTRWEGGDSESFIDFVAKWDSTRRELRNRDIKLEDWIDALLLMAMVPREFTSKLKDSELQDWKELKRENVIDRIQAYISAQGKEGGAAFYAKQNEKKKETSAKPASNGNTNERAAASNNNRDERPPLPPCKTCKDLLKLPAEKCKHAEEKCFNKERFAVLLKQLEQKQGGSAGVTRPFAAMALETHDTTEMESLYLAVDSESALLARTQTDYWIFDTGCTSSMTFKRDLMYDYEPVTNKSVRVGNNHVLNIAGRGKLAVELTDHHGQRQTMTLNNVLHIPRIACNLLSVTDMLDSGTKIVMSEDKLDVLHHEGFTFGSIRANGLYTIHLELVDCASSQSPEACLLADALLLHRRFGHVDLSKVDSDEYPETRVKDCDACIRGKFRRLPFNGNTPSVTEPLAQINADLFGPTRVATHSGARYLGVFIDACTGYVKVYHLKAKSEATDCFKSFRRWVENQTGKLIKNLRTDNGGEFDNQEMRKYCDSRGIEFRTTIPYTSAQNALAERRIGIILNDARTLLLDSGLPGEYWGYAAAHSVYLRNRIPRNGKEISPHEELLERKPRTDHLRVFGCAAYTWVPPAHRELGKLDARAELTTFLGFEEGTSNCLVVDRDSGRFFRARDVRFVESNIPGKGDPVPDLEFLDVQWEKEREAEHREPSKQNSTKADDLPLDLIVQHPPNEMNEESESDNDDNELLRPPSPVANRTRAAIRQRTLSPPAMTIHDEPLLNESDESSDELGLMVTSLETPRNMTDALKGPDAEGWRESLQKELDSIQKAGTWELIDRNDLPSGYKPIDSRLVLATKIDPSGGSDHKLKTRLCAKGFTQRHGIDYFETFSPVGHRQSFRLLLSITASLNLELKGLDITTAFLHGPLDETIYMRLPPEVELGHGKIAKLKKALYGLKQAGRCWNEELDRWLRSKGWIANEDDACVYLLKGDSGSIQLMLYVHVDDQAIAGHSEESINAFIDVLDSRFPCKRQGDLKHFLGMEIHRNRSEKKIWITQMQYTNRVLERFSLLSCKTRDVPMSPSVPSTLTIPNPEDIQAARNLPYRELTGSLQYLSTMSRPDITFAVNRMSSFNAGWTEKHFEICKGILRYIAGTRTHGIRLGGTEDGLQAYVDADWNADARDYKSTTGWIVKYNGGIIGWKSKKQSVQAHSTAEAEYMALDDVARDLVWERRSLVTLGMSDSISIPTPVAVDNQAAITLAKNKTSHDSTKHIHFRFHYIRSLITSKELSVAYLDTNFNHADILTKALPRDKFQYHTAGLGVEQPNVP